MSRYIYTVALLLFLAGATAPDAAKGQIDVSAGPRLGIPIGDLADDLGADVFLGGEARLDSPELPVVLKPSLDLYFSGDDEVTIFTVDLDAVYEFGVDNQVFTPYAGGGLGITDVSIDTGPRDVDDTEIGINLTGGARFLTEPVQPFVELDTTIGADFDRLAVTGGILFSP